MKITVCLENLDFSVNLYDNEFNKEMIKKFHLAESFHLTRITKPIPSKKADKKIIDSLWYQLRKAYYDFMSTIDSEDLLDIPIEFDGTNKWTNILHRIFTTAFHQKIYNGKKIILSSDGLKFVHQINDRCHDLEVYIINETINLWRDKSILYYEVSCSNLDVRRTLIDCEKYLELIDQNADVYILKHITGKDFLTAYFDEDTSNSWDVNNGQITYVGFTLDPFGDFKRAWNDPHFLSWIEKYNYTGKIGFIPIGTLSNEDKEKLKSFSKQNINMWKLPVKAILENSQ